MKKAIVTVTNDLSTDQRVDKVCKTLIKCGYEVLLIGREKKDSISLFEKPYKCFRFKLIFEKEMLFYAEYNIRLFFFLLIKKSDLLIANDLDTLLPNFLISKLKRIPIVYDSHEYFTGVPELANNNFARKVWLCIEKSIFPRLKHVFTVNESIATLYKNQYNVNVKVVRNIPLKNNIISLKTKAELNLPLDKKILILQGAGINVDRGVEELIIAMKYIDNAILLIIGHGDVLEKLKIMTSSMHLTEKILFKDRLPYNELMNYTTIADLGLTLDKNTNINYQFSLPNKLFDYISAGIPVLASDLIEIKRIIEKYQVGEILSDHRPESIAKSINSMLNNNYKMMEYKRNTLNASNDLCWENEEVELMKVYNLY